VLWIGAVTLLGLALRLWRIGDLGDLDFDEQASSFIGAMEPLAMLAYLVRAPFEHPPLFYLLFHGWLGIFGPSETAMRLFAVVPGTLTILVVGAGVARVAGPRGGAVAALVVALSPLQVFESRDARMYSLLSLLMSGLVVSLVPLSFHAPRGGSIGNRGRRFIAPLILSLLALATHYYALFGVVGAVFGALRTRARAEIAAIAPSLRRSGERVGVRGASRLWLGILLAGVSFAALAWLLAAPGLRTSLTAAYPRAVDLGALGSTILVSFGASLTGPLAAPGHAVWAGMIVVVVLLGCAWGAKRLRSGHGAMGPKAGDERESGAIGMSASAMAAIAFWGFVLVSVAVPLLMILGRPYAPRFVTLATPFLAVLVGISAVAFPWRWVAAGLGGYVAICAVFLAPFYAGYTRSDYGHALAALRAEVRPDDGIVLNGPWQNLLYQRYGWGLPPGVVIASTVPLDPSESIGWLERVSSIHPRLWVVDSATDAADPNGVVAEWLDTHAYPRPVIPFEKALLRPYLTDLGAGGALQQRSVDAGALDLRVVSVALDRWAVRPADELRLRVRAQPASRQSSPQSWTRLSAELLDPDGRSVWHWDGPLASAAGALEYRAAILIPSDAKSGAYGLRAVVYEASSAADGRRSVARISDPVVLGTINIRP